MTAQLRTDFANIKDRPQRPVFFMRLFTTQSLPWEAEGLALVEYFEEEWSAIEEGGGFLQ